MKKMWERPVAVVDEFRADEFVSACSDTTTEFYKFECNVPLVQDIYEGGIVNADGSVDLSGATLLTPNKSYGIYNIDYYTSCQATHYVEATESPFVSGVADSDYADNVQGSFTNVTIWKEPLDPQKYPSAVSAGLTYNLHATNALQTNIHTTIGNRS